MGRKELVWFSFGATPGTFSFVKRKGAWQEIPSLRSSPVQMRLSFQKESRRERKFWHAMKFRPPAYFYLNEAESQQLKPLDECSFVYEHRASLDDSDTIAVAIVLKALHLACKRRAPVKPAPLGAGQARVARCKLTSFLF